MSAHADNKKKPLWPLLAPLGLLAVLAAVLLVRGLSLTEGQLTYALDDSYVHMAMAKNFSQHGVWGITRHEFSSSSSSPLWTLLLAGLFIVTGPVDVVPLVLNLICAVLVVFVGYRLLTGGRSLARGGPVQHGTVAIALIALVLFVPVTALIATGQEHLLHLLLVLLFAGMVAERATAAGRDAAARKLPLALLVLAAALPLVRYESLFLVLAAGVLLASRGHRRAAVALGAAAVLPVLVFGLISVSKGWLFFPNSLVLKANLPGEPAGQTLRTLTGYMVLRRLIANAHLLVLAIVALAGLIALARRRPGGLARRAPTERSLREPARTERPGANEPSGASWVLLVLFLATLVLHLALADVGWFYRYEAYLVGFGLIALAVAWLELRARGDLPATRAILRGARGWAVAVLAVVTAGTLADRGVRAMIEAPRAMRNIHEQQIQMGRFLRDNYPGAVVAVNDIGAVNYLADVRCLDLMGLASRDVAAHLRAGTYGTRALEDLIRRHGVKVAIVYDNWIRIPDTWQRVGRWRIQDNVVTGGDTVSLYALDPAEAPRLAEALRRFAPRLPRSVQQAGAYMEG